MSKDTHTKAEKAAIAKALAKKQREAAKEAQIAAAKAKQEAAKATKNAGQNAADADAKAAAAAEKEAAKAAREAEKAKAEAARLKDVAQTEAKLIPVAKEINVRIEKATKLDGDADDHRLAAALKLAEAKALCEEHKISFKEWAEKNVTTQAYETIRKLAAVGASEDPKLALADMRGKNKEANKKHRAARAGGAGAGSRDTTAAGPRKSAFTIAEEAVAALDEKSTLSLLDSRARKVGMRVISEADAKAAKKAIEAAEKPVDPTSIDDVKAAFTNLKPSAKMEFIKWAAGQIGVSIATADYAAPASAAGVNEIPATLRRTPSRRAAADAPTAA